MKNKSTFWSAFIAGMASPASIVTPRSYHWVEGTDLERLREDVSRVGSDFDTVIKRENAKAKAACQQK
jgi:hypothetical protein